MQAILLRINTVAIVVILACVVGDLLFGTYALRVFGAEYEVGHWPLVLFRIGQTFRAASDMNQHLLSLAGYQTKTAGSCLVAVAMLIGETALLIPNFGVSGLAFAVLVADAVWAALMALQTQRLTGRRGDIISVLTEQES